MRVALVVRGPGSPLCPITVGPNAECRPRRCGAFLEQPMKWASLILAIGSSFASVLFAQIAWNDIVHPLFGSPQIGFVAATLAMLAFTAISGDHVTAVRVFEISQKLVEKTATERAAQHFVTASIMLLMALTVHILAPHAF
jgi:uncharacterized membrane protein